MFILKSETPFMHKEKLFIYVLKIINPKELKTNSLYKTKK